jgi:hypothetical protein
VSAAQQQEVDALRPVNGAAAADMSEPGEADVHGDVEDDDDAERSIATSVAEGRWFTRAELAGVGIPSPIRKLLEAALPD